MATTTSEYFILHPERARVSDLFSLLFTKKRLVDYDFIETNSWSVETRSATSNLLLVFLLIIMKFLIMINRPSKKLTSIAEYCFNFLYINGGFLRMIWRCITVSAVKPIPGTATYRSYKSFAVEPVKLDKKITSLIDSSDCTECEVGFKDDPYMNLAVLASYVSGENAARVEHIVTNEWKMNFVEFFDGYNLFLEAHMTQGFIFSDKPEDAQLIMVAFRGSDELNDYITNFDISWITMGKLGRVHIGFMKALGLQDDKDFIKGFPLNYNGNKPLAYYTIRETLIKLLDKHKNAKIIFTGFSLGGALAILYPSLLIMHDQQDILSRIQGVFTFGQPRVGDKTFGENLTSNLGARYERMVYRFDIVPRIPWDLSFFFWYKHFGACIYYRNVFRGKKVDEVPNKNCLELSYWPQMMWAVVDDIFIAIWLALTTGEWEGWWAYLKRALWIFFPPPSFHNIKSYINAVKKAKISYKFKA